MLLVEAMTGEHSQIARLSFSTKLTDYLYAGKCILSIGADNIGPMEYLKQKNAALCASTEEAVYEMLLRIVEDPAIITQMAQAAYACGKKNHARPLIQEKVDATFMSLCGK